MSLPTPDFSMPYNVICLACTVVAIAFGSLHNLTTRRFVAVDPEKRRGNPLHKLKNLFSRKKSDDATENQKEDKTDDVDTTKDKEEDENKTEAVRKRKTQSSESDS